MYGTTTPAHRQRVPQLIALAALAIAGLLIAAQAAAAAPKDPINGVETTLKVNKKVGKALANANVKVKTKGSAKTTNKGLNFPITGGSTEPGEVRGKVEHKGSKLRLKKGKTKTTVSNPVINLNKAKLDVGVKGGKLKLFDLNYSKAKVKRDGFGTTYSKVQARVSKAFKKVLKRSYGVNVKKGTKFGTAKVAVQPEEVSLMETGDTNLVPDSGAAAALAGAGISLAPIAPATAGMDGFAFPITGGKLNVDDLTGKINHSGGIRFTKGGVNVDLTEFTIQVDSDPDLVASLGASRVSILSLDLGSAAIDISGRDITVSGVKAALTEGAAAALNAAFSTTLFTEGLVIGTANVMAEAN